MMSETLESKLDRGLQVVQDIMGGEFAAKLRATATSRGFGSTAAQLAVEYCFADGWGRAGLAKRDRSLVMLGALVGLGHAKELKNHVKIGLANGLTVREIEEVLIQAMPYVGVPAIARALSAVVEALREAGLDPGVPTSEEAGLL